jgi:hypothetical protein
VHRRQGVSRTGIGHTDLAAEACECRARAGRSAAAAAVCQSQTWTYSSPC